MAQLIICWLLLQEHNMACIINASTSAGLVQTADTSGILQFQQNGVALPNGGVAPTFAAYQSSAQTLSSSTLTKVQFQTKEYLNGVSGTLWDTNSNYDTSTYRFTPTVAGYYQVNATVQVGVSSTIIYVYIYKNGSSYKQGQTSVNSVSSSANSLVYLNGSTDYIEIYSQLTVGQALAAGSSSTYFNASLVRGT
jgi:hypothetical protein